MRLVLSVFAGVAILTLPTLAQARLARCFTTDDGYYDCNFKATDKDGSFEINAPKQPFYAVIMDEPGLALASLNVGAGRTVPLPGKFKRNKQDLACWRNALTRVQICVW